MFVDKVTVQIKAGNGGDGCVSFRHEKYINKGGPDGGDGGQGGDIVVVASNNENTLARFRYDKKIIATDGKAGFKKRQRGKSAPDKVIPLPVGTIVTDELGVVRADLCELGQEVTIAKGGKGGFGNAHFVSSTRQAPRFAEKGELGEAYEATFELKTIADIGLVGLPNAGKSTLLSVLTRATPAIADYPFTTLTPKIGVAQIGNDRQLLLADIPGLIEGASQGKGLGDEFLRHIERTAVIIHCVDVYNENIDESYRIVRRELKNYSTDLSVRPEIIALTKTEGFDEEIINMQIKALSGASENVSTPVIPISAQAHQGLKQLLEAAYKTVENRRKAMIEESAESDLPIISPAQTEATWKVARRTDGIFVITGEQIERFAVRTDFGSEEAIRRLKTIMKKKGMTHELARYGSTSGDIVVFGDPEVGRITL